MPSDPQLESRRRLIRSFGSLREMIRGFFVENQDADSTPELRNLVGADKAS